jgi:hypothetical protein
LRGQRLTSAVVLANDEEIRVGVVRLQGWLARGTMKAGVE